MERLSCFKNKRLSHAINSSYSRASKPTSHNNSIKLSVTPDSLGCPKLSTVYWNLPTKGQVIKQDKKFSQKNRSKIRKWIKSRMKDQDRPFIRYPKELGTCNNTSLVATSTQQTNYSKKLRSRQTPFFKNTTNEKEVTITLKSSNHKISPISPIPITSISIVKWTEDRQEKRLRRTIKQRDIYKNRKVEYLRDTIKAYSPPSIPEFSRSASEMSDRRTKMEKMSLSPINKERKPANVLFLKKSPFLKVKPKLTLFHPLKTITSFI
ncbi:unnamed protein product [Moneuplotes crassus]|uniref:Uncharacterized protein n=1 Tax=Euplotes crassus TaxID=5936 RepID=A0AAD1UD26_EUPCR|nr:unnamed protein product [Moneuplotes crassus]